MDHELQLLRQGIHHRDTDTVETAGNLVRVVVELTPGVEDRHDHFRRRTSLFRVHAHRNAAPIVGHRHGLVRVDGNGDFLAESRQSFVDRVVDDLENHVVKSGAVIRVTDVHTRTFTDRFEPL